MAAKKEAAAPKGIKEISEILDALELTLNTVGVVMADGKVDFSDIPAALKLVNNYEKFINAVKGAQGVIEEAKDLDETEAIAIGLRMFKIITGVTNIIKQVK